MKWLLAMVAGVVLLTTVAHFWAWVPAIGLAAGWGYFCGANRWRNERR